MRKFYAASAALIAISLTGAMVSSSSGASKPPLKIALIPPTTGSLAAFGADEVRAWKLAAKLARKNNWAATGGHPVQLTVTGSDGKTANTINEVRKQVSENGNHYMSGPITSTEYAALNPLLPSLDVIAFNTTAKDDSLTGANCSPNMFRTIQSLGMDVNTMGPLMKKFKAKTWALQAADYLPGHTTLDLAEKALKKLGKKVLIKQYAPLNTSDFSSYITKLKNAKAEGLFVFHSGADATSLVNQGAQFELFKQYKTVLGLSFVAESQFTALKDKGIVGFHNNLGYDWSLNNKINKAFVKAYKKDYKVNPYFINGDAYIAATMLFAAVKKAKSVETSKVRKALKGVKFNSIVGKVQMDTHGQLVRPNYVAQIVKKGGSPSGLGWKIIGSATGKQIYKRDPACKL